MDTYNWLQDWYQRHCDGDWEHSSRIQIHTIDNPGWSVSINLECTNLEKKLFEEVKIERSETDWIFCKVVNGIFKSAGGPKNLEEMLRIFRTWADGS